MKKIIAIIALLVSVTAFAGIGDPQQVLSFTSSAYSVGGTNETTGYTNSTVYVDLSKGTTVTYNVHMQGYSVNFSNNVTLVVTPAFSSATADVATTSTRYAIAANGNTTTVTNIVVTSFGAPGAKITLENPATNPVSITNLVVKVFVKSP